MHRLLHLAFYSPMIAALMGCATAPPPRAARQEPYTPRVEEPQYVQRVSQPAPIPQTQARYEIFDSPAVQQLPNRYGGVGGLKTAGPLPVTLPNGPRIIVYRVERLDYKVKTPLKIGDILYAVDGAIFTSPDGMPRYVQSLAPGSTAEVEYLPNGRAPSRFATIQIISDTTTTYPGRKPAPSGMTKEQERKMLESYIIAGATYGAVIQAIIDALGGSPSVSGPVYAPSPGSGGDGGLGEASKRSPENQPKAEDNSHGAYEAPEINPFYGKDHTVK